jgi:hypothetical protein
MKRLWAGGLAVAMGLQSAGVALAQSSLDALEEELKEVQLQHDDATTQNLTNFFNQVDQAMVSNDAAVALWQQAGGAMPPPTPVTTVHETESASERDARLAQDKANADQLGGILQLHCGLLHYAALFVTKPNRKGLQQDFNGWLQRAAQVYPQLTSAAPPAGDAGGPRRRRDAGGSSFRLGDIKSATMKGSVISGYLGFKSWGDKEAGGWSVNNLPTLYKTDILDPARATPTADTLADWDIYIAMEQAEEPDADKWTSTDLPPLQFERACDDYAIRPSAEKLETLVQIIHANPTHPKADEWLQRAKDLLATLRGGKPAGAAATPIPAPAPAAVTNGNVTVSTIQQGDAQIIITHTNATPNPAPPR